MFIVRVSFFLFSFILFFFSFHFISFLWFVIYCIVVDNHRYARPDPDKEKERREETNKQTNEQYCKKELNAMAYVLPSIHNHSSLLFLPPLLILLFVTSSLQSSYLYPPSSSFSPFSFVCLDSLERESEE